MTFVEEYGMKPTSTHKTWVFTLNNYTTLEWNTLSSLDCTRRALGIEEGSQNSVPHIQGFLAFSKGYRLSGLKKLSPRAHWERCKSPLHAWNYCLKDGKFTLTDNRVGQGRRTDVEQYRDAIKAGYTDYELCESYPHQFLKFNRTGHMRRAYTKRRMTQTKCKMYLGPPGTGKSYKCKMEHPDADWLEYDGRFFSHYENKEVVIFDDLELDKFEADLVKRLVNHTPMKIRVLGGYKEFTSKLIIFCTNYLPRWYSDPAVRKRIELIEMNNIYEPSENNSG